MQTSNCSKKDFRNAIFSCWLGTAMEYADFALYGLAAATVFGTVFYPEQTKITALLLSFATFGVGFIARPIGAFVFGRLGDKMGRKAVMMITICLMGISTTLIGFLPSYASIGIFAPLLLVILRFLQGFGAGAELSGGAIMLAEFAPPKRRGLISSIIALGSNSGTLIASGLWFLLGFMDKQNFIEWGWRLPFIFSFLIALFAFYLRRFISETPVFEEEKRKMQEIRDKHLENYEEHESFFKRTKAFWVMVMLRIGENGPSYLAQGFLVGYVSNVLLLDKQVATQSVLLASFLGFLIIPLAGYLSDKFGRRIMYRICCGLIFCYAIPAFWLLDVKDPTIVTLVIIGAMSLASLAIFGVQAAYGVELFGVKSRYTKMALAKEIGGICSGGTAPMLASYFIALTGNWYLIAAYWMLCAAIGFIGTFIAPETRGRDLNLAEDAL